MMRGAALARATPMLIETRALTLRRGDRELFRDLTLTVQAGERWGLIGPNGAGKSTLLAALAGGDGGPRGRPGGPGVAAPGTYLVDGRVRRAPGVWLAAVDQGEGPQGDDPAATLYDLAHAACAPLVELGAELERRAAALGAAPSSDALEAYGAWQALFGQRGGYDLEARLDEALTRIGLPRAAATPAPSASGGERRRARLAGALVSGADVLLLDEPTNHLDLGTRGWLAEQLQRFRGAVVFAAHDRAWIDAVATHVLVLGEGAPRFVRGGWTVARRGADEVRRAEAKSERLRRRREAELEAMAAELRAQGHRRADVRRRRAERELDALRAKPRPAPAPQGPAVALAGGAGGGELARFEHLSAGATLVDVALTLRGGDRWALIGPSGSGKSTLLRLLAGEVESDDPRARRWWRPGTSLWHVDQHRRGIPDDATPLAAVTAWVGAGQAEGLLAATRLPRATWSRPAATLSGGERARAGLALLMAREADVLLLDEPTNDLDLPAIEALEAALVATTATLVVATHDARLVEALGAEVATIEAGALVRWRGGLAGWRRGARRLTAGADAEAGGGVGEPSTRASGGIERLPAAAPPDEDAVDRERATADAVLTDPLRWGERETMRWRERRRAAEEALLAAWETSAAPPEPPYRTREAGWRVWAEPVDRGLHVWLDGEETLAHATVLIAATPTGRVGHLVVPRADDRALARWAFHALLHGATRLAVYTHAVEAVQVAADHGPGGFEALAPGWWVRRRAAVERDEGWRRAGPTRSDPRRRTRRRRRATVRAPGGG
jgi:ATP-binding cassette, subfamily F, member 3